MEEKKAAFRVLLVDDETAITDNLAPFLERSGFVVGVAADGEAGLRLAQQFDPELIVLDVLMPGLDGRRMLRQLRQAGNWRAASTPARAFLRCTSQVSRICSSMRGRGAIGAAIPTAPPPPGPNRRGGPRDPRSGSVTRPPHIGS